MQKTLLYLGILGILGFGVWFFLYSDRSNVFGAEEAGFTIRDTGAIGKIFIADNSGRSVTLTRHPESGWMANEHKALDAQIRQILKTLYQQTPLYPVPKEAHNGVIKGLAGNAIKVEVYDRQGDRMRTFFVGGEVKDFEGTYMLMEGAKKPYVVGIAGYSGYLTPRYNPDVITWRDRTIFNIPAEAITKASVQYDQEPLNSFTIQQQGSKVSATIHPELMAGKVLNQRRTEAFLRFFEKVNSVAVVSGKPGLDSILREMPKVATIEVAGKNNYHQRADIFFYPLNKRSKNLDAPDEGLASNYDSDHYYGVLNGGRDTVILQQRMLTKIFRRGFEFYTPDEEAPIKEAPLP